MKNKLLRIAWTLPLAALLLAEVGCEGKEHTDQQRGKGGILLWADIDQVKWGKIKEVLGRKSETDGASQRSELFRLRRYSPDNPPVDEGGTLCDAVLIRSIDDVDKHAATEKFKGYAVQIGLGAVADFETRMTDAEKPGESGGKKDPTPTPEPGKLMPHAHFQENIAESQKMVDEVNAILDGTADKSSP